jgi:hypothetical protein
VNDEDWMKKFRRGPKGGCAAWALALLTLPALGALARAAGL